MTIRDSYSASIIVTLQLPIKYNPKIIHIVNQRYIRSSRVSFTSQLTVEDCIITEL